MRATADVFAGHGDRDRFDLDVERLREPAGGEAVVDAGGNAEFEETGRCLDRRQRIDGREIRRVDVVTIVRVIRSCTPAAGCSPPGIVMSHVEPSVSPQRGRRRDASNSARPAPNIAKEIGTIRDDEDEPVRQNETAERSATIRSDDEFEHAPSSAYVGRAIHTSRSPAAPAPRPGALSFFTPFHSRSSAGRSTDTNSGEVHATATQQPDSDAFRQVRPVRADRARGPHLAERHHRRCADAGARSTSATATRR